MRKLCGFLAALMLLTCIGIYVPETVEAKSSLPYYIKVNRQQNCVTIYGQDDKGEYTVPVKAMACSVGVNNATPTGTFSLGGKYRWHELMGSVYGQYCSRITGGVLFHSVFYHVNGDPSTLYYNAYNNLGNTASHGCVRLSVGDAKWIYDNCPSGTKVTIYDSSDPGPLGKPSSVKIDTSSSYRGWDPTDPDERNPWKKTYPTISGLKDLTVERGSKSVNLKKGVTASDYLGTALKVKVSGKCNTKKTGKYKITYSATDSSGKTTTKSITITVKDTKKPTAKVVKKTLTYQKAVSEKTLLKDLKANITAKDSGEALASKYITVNAKKLISAMANKKAGTYTVTAYAKDKAGNKSKKVSFTVKYMGVKPVVRAVKKTLTYQKAVSEKQLLKDLKANVTATENGKTMSAKSITVSAEKLIKAMKNKTYGTYTVKAYAKNSMGKKSKVITFTVKFTKPETKPDDTTQEPADDSTEETPTPGEEEGTTEGDDTTEEDSTEETGSEETSTEEAGSVQ